jgi:O-antigen/teichoic acid export membrane protein
MSDKDTYKETLKVTGLFGGVQVFSILIGLVRTKLVAVLLGTAGAGINTLFSIPFSVIGPLAEMGINASGVREYAKTKALGDEEQFSKTVTTVRRWTWLTGILGMLMTIVLAPFLSKWSFDDYDHTWAFVLLSVTALLLAKGGGSAALIRGLRRVKDTAKAGLYGSITGLLASVPLYYFYGQKGIVPALIISGFITWFWSWYFSGKINVKPVRISHRESFFRGKEMIRLGIIITANALIANVVLWIINLFIRQQSGVEAVGIYATGMQLTSSSVSLIFSAMTIDYFPRLVMLQSNHLKMKEAVNQQAEIALLAIAPIMILFVSLLPIVIWITAKGSFMPIVDFIPWMIFGMLLRSASWALSHVILAKGDNKLFFWMETLGQFVLLVLTVGCYLLSDLEGIGIAYSLFYLFYFGAMYVVTKKRYEISFNRTYIKIFLFQFVLCSLCFFIVYLMGYPAAYFLGSLLFVVSGLYSLKMLNERMDLKAMILSRIKKGKK